MNMIFLSRRDGCFVVQHEGKGNTNYCAPETANSGERGKNKNKHQTPLRKRKNPTTILPFHLSRLCHHWIVVIVQPRVAVAFQRRSTIRAVVESEKRIQNNTRYNT